MALVRGRGNKSTEVAAVAAFRRHGVTGWRRHVDFRRFGGGRPDFYFPRARLAVFVDGCFWHGCPVCARRTPRNRSAFWQSKLDANVRRDRRVRRALNRAGIQTLRVWEHAMRDDRWVSRVVRQLDRSRPGETLLDQR